MTDYMNGKVQDQSTASGSSLKRKYNVARKTQESPLPFGAQAANTSVSLDDVKHSDRANHQSRNDTSHKSREAGSSSALHPKYSNKSLHQQSKSLPGKSPTNVFAEATVVHQKENNGMHQLANATGSRQSSQASVSTFQLCLQLHKIHSVSSFLSLVFISVLCYFFWSIFASMHFSYHKVYIRLAL